MHLWNGVTGNDNDKGVSVVVGIMLMLVVVVIIAALVSGYAGGMIKTNQKAPNLAMDVKITNDGYWHGSGFFATVTAVSEPIPTKDLRILTSWKHGTEIGGATTVADTQNINTLFAPNTTLGSGLYVAPFGIGPGVNETGTLWGEDTNTTAFSGAWQQFGNYTLVPGTTLTAQPCGAKDGGRFGSSGENNHYGGYGADNASYEVWVEDVTTTCYYRFTVKTGTINSWGCCAVGDTTCSAYKNYAYYLPGGSMYKYIESGRYQVYTQEVTTPGHYNPVAATSATKYRYVNCGSSCIDPAKALLGTNWNNLIPGDTVNVRVIHIPTGKTIFNQDVPVTEA
ncbi:MAG: type IV pilin N-terminal domain-containing protein [Methanoregula sp.]|nr:type IV pilin N-terminal domain-containing protein [Methanoregula sp.]